MAVEAEETAGAVTYAAASDEDWQAVVAAVLKAVVVVVAVDVVEGVAEMKVGG